MKFCFIGVGSIAQRHIKNIDKLFQENGENVPLIDVLRSGRTKKLPDDLEGRIHCVYYDYSEMPGDYDIIFITNPTNMHYETLKMVHKKGKHFFIEKPVFATGEESIKALSLRENSVYYVACPLRYCDVIQYIKTHVNFDEIYSIRCISSSYLPEWRPGIDYRYTYSAKKELGGGVSIDLIHEWDYISYLVGMPERVLSITEKVSDLEIDTDDIAVYIARYSSMTVELHLDYFGRYPIRQIELYGKNETIVGDLLSGRIHFLKSGNLVAFDESRDEYQIKELKHFFKLVEENAESDNDLSAACKILRIARGERI